MLPLISIIVPVYNAEKFVSRCIESLIGQEYSNVEIILVNDGSSDKSPAICDVYARKDRRVHVIHKKNGGVSSARNAGIDLATGKYVCFVDSDDHMTPDGIITMKQALDRASADLCIGAIANWKAYVDSDEHVVVATYPRKVLEVLVRDNSYSSLAKLYRLDIVKKYAIRFPESQRCSEDTIFVREYFSVISSFVTIPNVVYICDVSNQNSLSKQGYAEYAEYRINKMKVLMKVCSHLALDEDDIKQFISCRAIHSLRITMRHYMRNWDDEKIRNYHILRSVDLLLPWINIDEIQNMYMEVNLVKWWRRMRKAIAEGNDVQIIAVANQEYAREKCRARWVHRLLPLIRAIQKCRR